MSWHEMTHYELQAMRKLLMLDVKEAADCIGRCSARTWQRWENGDNKVPSDVETEIYGLIGNRNLVIGKMIDIEIEPVSIKFYKTIDGFLADYPESNLVSWRLHQSIVAYLFAEGGDIELNEATKTDKNSYLFKFFSKTRKEDIEFIKQIV
mgnify:CR=1 FL=1